MNENMDKKVIGLKFDTYIYLEEPVGIDEAESWHSNFLTKVNEVLADVIKDNLKLGVSGCSGIFHSINKEENA